MRDTLDPSRHSNRERRMLSAGFPDRHAHCDVTSTRSDESAREEVAVFTKAGDVRQHLVKPYAWTAPSLGIRPTNEGRDLLLVGLAQEGETRSRPDERAPRACRNVYAECIGRLNDPNVLGEDAVACGKRNCLEQVQLCQNR